MAGRRSKSRCASVNERAAESPLLMHEYYAVTTPRPDPDPVLAHPRNVALGSREDEVSRAANGSSRTLQFHRGLANGRNRRSAADSA